MRRRVDPLYLASAALAIVTVIVLIATTTGPSTTTARTGSVNDDGAGGATAVRRYLEAMGASTSVVQGDAFDPSGAKVLMMLGASELVSDADTAKIQAFVRGGGTAIVATDVGLLERSLLNAFNVRVSGLARPGALTLTGGAFVDPPASQMQIDRGVALGASTDADVLATDGQAPVIVSVSQGSGLFIVVGSLWPFLGSGIAQAENGRAILTLARGALDHGVVAFDEYHHGAHPSADVLVLVQQTLDVHSYQVKLDLSEARDASVTGYRSTTTIVFSAEETTETFVDFIHESIRSITLNGVAVDPATAVTGSRIYLENLLPGEDSPNTLVVDGKAPTPAPARACTASSTRRTARSTSTPSTSRPTPAGSSPTSSSPT